MKILVIAPTNFFSDRGCHIRIYNEAKYLKEKNHQIKIVAFDKGADIASLEVVRIAGTFLNKKKSPGFSWGRIWADWKLLFLTMREIKNFKPAVIHAHLYDGLAVGYLAKKILCKKIPIIADIQGDLKKEFESYNRQNFFAKIIFPKFSKRVIDIADYVAVSSENILEQMKKIYKNKDRVFLLEDGVDLELFEKNNLPKKEVMEELEKIKKWKEDGKILIYAGGLEESKGVGGLIRNFENVLANWKLIVFGKGKERERYKQFVEKRELGSKIYFVENLDYFALSSYQSLADCAIDPKQNSTEGSGKLVGYMASGLPVICFENKNSRNFLSDKGIFLKNLDELDEVLCLIEKQNQKPHYDLSAFDMKNKIEKLELILKKIDAKNN